MSQYSLENVAGSDTMFVNTTTELQEISELVKKADTKPCSIREVTFGDETVYPVSALYSRTSYTHYTQNEGMLTFYIFASSDLTFCGVGCTPTHAVTSSIDTYGRVDLPGGHLTVKPYTTMALAWVFFT